MNKYNIGDRVILNKTGSKGIIISKVGYKWEFEDDVVSVKFIRDGEVTKIGQNLPISGVRLDIQYYRQLRLNKILG